LLFLQAQTVLVSPLSQRCPELVQLCDIVHIYDNSSTAPFRIFKKRKTRYFAAENDIWTLNEIAKLTGVNYLEPFPAKS
jgi:hypothetical protein